MTPDLHTTNLLLGIMAGVSVLEALVIIGVGIAGFMAYRQVMALVEKVTGIAQGIEARQVAPVMLRVNAILDDVKDVTAQDNSGAVLKQLEESLGSLKAKANESGDAMLALGTKAAALATAAAIAVKAVGELGTAVSGALDLGTQLENLSKKTGLSAETLSVLRYTAKLTGEDFESSAKAVSKLDKSIADAAAGFRPYPHIPVRY